MYSQRERDRTEYYSKKESGICVRHGCTDNANAGVYCEAHRSPNKPYMPKFAESNWYTAIKKFGWVRADVDRILEDQSYRCAICGGIDEKKRLSFDHDHATLKPRGFLCWRCNIVLGHVEDNIELLQKMIQYLERG